MDSGTHGMEFFYEKTLPDFIQAASKLDWDWYETFSQFENVLEGSYKGYSYGQPPHDIASLRILGLC